VALASTTRVAASASAVREPPDREHEDEVQVQLDPGDALAHGA
jgi:hypothetical protein